MDVFNLLHVRFSQLSYVTRFLLVVAVYDD
jgi:hypothetical protein